MSRIEILESSFTGGEVSPLLLGRGDLVAYENGAARLRNVFIQPTGGVTRRSGLRYVDSARGPGRLVAFEFNTEQVYLMVFTDGWLDVYREEEKVAEAAAPWTAAQLEQIVWTQSADTLLVTHPDVPPQRITRTGEAAWTVEPLAFASEDGVSRQPFYRHATDVATLQPSAVSGSVTLTASADVFVAGHVDVRLRIAGREVMVTAVASATEATATTLEDLVGTDATTDWTEQAFSPLRGWPVSIAFHQDRLVLGGSRDLPNRLWLSKSGDLFNFDLGTGLDDEAIEFPILSDQVNAIRAVFSGRHLQVFTSGAEWMVTGDPLTPSSLQVKRQTRVGSPVDRSLPPRDVDGATLFVSRNGRELREFLYADVEQAYRATDLALLARHLFRSPRDIDYEAEQRLLHLAMADGSVATLTIYRTEQVTAWTRQETDGAVLALAVVGEAVYALIDRAGDVGIEVFDPAVLLDATLSGSSPEPAAVWSGLGHLEGRTVKVLADGTVRPDAVVAGGAITLDVPARDVTAGLAYAHEIEPLPPAIQGRSVHGARLRPVRHTFRLHETAALTVDTGHGPRDVPFRRLGGEGTLDGAAPVFSGDRSLRALGWHDTAGRPLWRVSQDTPLPCTILSVNTQVKVND